MENLLEAYRNKLKSINELIEKNKNNGSINDIKRAERLETKRSEYRSFITDIEREMSDDNKNLSDIMFNYLKNNLNINISTTREVDYDDKYTFIEVSLLLENEEISRDNFRIY